MREFNHRRNSYITGISAFLGVLYLLRIARARGIFNVVLPHYNGGDSNFPQDSPIPHRIVASTEFPESLRTPPLKEHFPPDLDDHSVPPFAGTALWVVMWQYVVFDDLILKEMCSKFSDIV